MRLRPATDILGLPGNKSTNRTHLWRTSAKESGALFYTHLTHTYAHAHTHTLTVVLQRRNIVCIIFTFLRNAFGPGPCRRVQFKQHMLEHTRHMRLRAYVCVCVRVCLCRGRYSHCCCGCVQFRDWSSPSLVPVGCTPLGGTQRERRADDDNADARRRNVTRQHEPDKRGKPRMMRAHIWASIILTHTKLYFGRCLQRDRPLSANIIFSN